MNFINLNRQCSFNDGVFIFVSVIYWSQSDPGREDESRPQRTFSLQQTHGTTLGVRHPHKMQRKTLAAAAHAWLQPGWERGQEDKAPAPVDVEGELLGVGGAQSICMYCGWPQSVLIIISIHKHVRVKYSHSPIAI